MTNEEAIAELEWVKERGFVADVGIIGTDRIVEAVSMAIKALEKQDKYKWHDLRKNPEDLPKYNKEVLVIYGKDTYDLSTLYKDSEEGDYWSADSWIEPVYDSDVFAWKYIETFEEESWKSVVGNVETHVGTPLQL